jgi:hypothetical protein
MATIKSLHDTQVKTVSIWKPVHEPKPTVYQTVYAENSLIHSFPHRQLRPKAKSVLRASFDLCQKRKEKLRASQTRSPSGSTTHLNMTLKRLRKCTHLLSTGVTIKKKNPEMEFPR